MLDDRSAERRPLSLQRITLKQTLRWSKRLLQDAGLKGSAWSRRWDDCITWQEWAPRPFRKLPAASIICINIFQLYHLVDPDHFHQPCLVFSWIFWRQALLQAEVTLWISQTKQTRSKWITYNLFLFLMYYVKHWIALLCEMCLSLIRNTVRTG